MKLELCDHPARTVNEEGERVPLLPDMRSIKADGKSIGYCTAAAGFPVTLTYAMSDDEKAEIKKFVEGEIGSVKFVSAPPSPEQLEAVEEFLETGVDPNDEDNDEDEDGDDAD